MSAIEEIILTLLIFIPAFALGAYIGWDIARRNFQRQVHHMLYDFDKDKREFDEWIAQRMAEVKSERAKWN